jgi:Spy/CpxP family protein refolding chaperone
MMTHHGCVGEHLHHLLKHQKELGLTDEQVTKLKAIGLDTDRAWIKGRADIRIAERELLALLEDNKSDLSAIEAKVKQSEMLEVTLRMVAYKARRDALAVLTPEQREKAKASHERMMREMMMSGQMSGYSGKGHHQRVNPRAAGTEPRGIDARRRSHELAVQPPDLPGVVCDPRRHGLSCAA